MKTFFTLLIAMSIFWGCEKGVEPDALKSELSACPSPCPNNFTVSVVPYGSNVCNCLLASISYESSTGPVTNKPFFRNTNGNYSVGTGFNSICPGSDIEVCFDKDLTRTGCSDPETTCMSGLLLVGANGLGIFQYPFCLDVSGGVCFTIGQTQCCQSTSSWCKWIVDSGYDNDFVACTPCGTGYSCTN